MIVWSRTVWKNLTALALLIGSLSVGMFTASDAQAGSRHGGHSARGHGGHHSMHAVAAHSIRVAPVQVVRPHYAVASHYVHAPSGHHGHAGYAAGYGHARLVHDAAPARIVHHQPMVYRHVTYTAGHRACTPRPHCVC
jgi:hypothetical protein